VEVMQIQSRVGAGVQENTDGGNAN